MSELLVIIPPNWTSLDWLALKANFYDMNANNVNNAIATRNMAFLEDVLKPAGLIPQEASILDAKLLDDAFFMVLLGY